MAPKQSRHDGGADLALRQQLAEMKKVSLEEVGRIRMTPQKMPSLVDVGVILTGKSSHDVARDLRCILDKHPDLGQKVPQIKFGGRGNQDTPVPKNLATLIEIIFLLPGRSAAKVQQSAAQIFVRYLGGDLSLIHEVERMNHVQTFLRENDPEHALKVLLPNQQPLSPRSMRVVQDELRTGLLGRERPDASLGKPVYCSRFLQEHLFLKDWAAKERAKVFGNDVKTAVRAMFPDYDLDARTNRSVDGHDREPHLYFETHLPAFFAALPKYVARAAEVKDDELTREGLQKKRAGSEESMRNFFRPR
jgi:hypothetical protein